MPEFCAILFMFGYVSYCSYHFSVDYKHMYEYWRMFRNFVELGFPSMESSFISFVKKPCLLCVFIFVSGALCSVYFLHFIASYHLPFILLLFCISSCSLVVDVILCNC